MKYLIFSLILLFSCAPETRYVESNVQQVITKAPKEIVDPLKRLPTIYYLVEFNTPGFMVYSVEFELKDILMETSTNGKIIMFYHDLCGYVGPNDKVFLIQQMSNGNEGFYIVIDGKLKQNLSIDDFKILTLFSKEQIFANINNLTINFLRNGY